MDDYDRGSDAMLFARLRNMWEEFDPAPADLADRMVAAMAVADLSGEYELLTLVEASPLGAVRSAADTATLQFSDGRTSILLHVTATEDGLRRIDGWVEPEALTVFLVQDERYWSTEPGTHGRFAFVSVPPGVFRLRNVVRTGDGELRVNQTPKFEV